MKSGSPEVQVSILNGGQRSEGILTVLKLILDLTMRCRNVKWHFVRKWERNKRILHIPVPLLPPKNHRSVVPRRLLLQDKDPGT